MSVVSTPRLFFLMLIGFVLAMGLQKDCHVASSMIPTFSSTESPDKYTLVKYTMATERDPMQAMVFALRYLKMEPRYDGPWGNIWNCSLGQVLTARPDFSSEGAGICTIITSGAGSVVATNACDVAVSLDKARFSSCVFDENKIISLSQDSMTYQVHASAEKQCCLACQADKDCLGSNYAPGLNHQAEVGFAFHFPATRVRSTGSALTVDDIERIVEAKVDGMTEFDAFMDFNLGIFTNDIDSFIETLETGGVIWFPARWPLGAITMYSVFVNVPTTQHFVEVMGSKSMKLKERDMKLMEQRMPESKMLQIFAEVTGDRFLPVRISRAATDVDKIEQFYGRGLQLKTVLSLEESDVRVRCYEVSNDTESVEPIVCFTKRPDSATKGSFKVGAFEDMLYKNAVHLTESPLCNINRWFDNHYAVVPMSGLGDHIVDFVDANPEIPHVCDASGLYYLADPTGWAIQFSGGVGSRAPATCGGYPVEVSYPPFTTTEVLFCGFGTCSASDLAKLNK